jgi:hypothetical protein
MSDLKIGSNPDEHSPPTYEEEAITLVVDWTPEEEKRAKRK